MSRSSQPSNHFIKYVDGLYKFKKIDQVTLNPLSCEVFNFFKGVKELTWYDKLRGVTKILNNKQVLDLLSS